MMIYYFNILSTRHIAFMFSSLKMLGHIIFFNDATTLANDIIIDLEGVGHDVVVVLVMYNIYILYISDKSLSRFRSDFFVKHLWSDLHHKLKKT